jgi:hypothetical protein
VLKVADGLDVPLSRIFALAEELAAPAPDDP